MNPQQQRNRHMTFSELLEELNIPRAPQGHHHQTQGWIQFDCPFCGKDSSNFHMGYNLSGGFVNCWRCGGHNLAVVLSIITGLPLVKIVPLISQLDGYEEAKVHEQARKRVLKLPPNLSTLKQPHVDYLKHRGFNVNEILNLWRVQATPIVGPLKHRLFVPIIHKGQVVSWTTRSLSNNGQRYISAKADEEFIAHKSILYGQDYVRHTALVVEGPTDVWAIGPGAIATFGINVSRAQITQLMQYPRAIVCFDNEWKAQQMAQSLCNELGAIGGEVSNVVLDSKDPGEANSKELKQLRKFLE